MTKPGIDDLQAAVQSLQAACEASPDKSRQPIRPDQELPLELSDRERKLILEHAFADEALLGRLRVAPTPNQRAVFHFTLDDLEDLAGCVAAEATPKTRSFEKSGIVSTPESAMCWIPTSAWTTEDT